MIICPVCEHPQAQGTECDVCGKQFGRGLTPEPPVQRLPDLELTRPEGMAPVPTARLPELELTRYPAGPEIPAAGLPDFDPGRAGAVQVPLQALPDLDVHRLPANPAERTPAPSGAVVCRYCRNVQAQGMLCDRCGMRLPRTTATAAGDVAASPDGPVWVIHGCGARTPAGAACGSCGAYVPLP